MELKDLKTVRYGLYNNKCNYKKIPVNYTTSIDEFNYLVEQVKQIKKVKKGIKRTPSGGISVRHERLLLNQYDVFTGKTGFELIYLNPNGAFRVQHRLLAENTAEENKMTGKECLRAFEKELKADGVNLKDFVIDNGKEVKATIQKAKIDVKEKYVGMTIKNACHIDIHNSYPSGMCEYHPEWRNTIERLYNNRKTNPENKLILNATCGIFQSQFCDFKGYGLADVSEYAIRRNNEKIEQMDAYLISLGCIIIAHNTDGIWFVPSKNYTPIHSSKLGEFDQDHTNCTIRFKSKGAYEYIEDGQYHAVLRGTTKLDKIKPRSEWTWGDIYDDDAVVIAYVLDENDYITERGK